MCLNTDRADAWATAAMRNGKSLMQIQVCHVWAELARSGKADHGIHVGTVHVDLATIFVDDLANLDDGFLEYTVGGRIGDHKGGKTVTVFRCLRFQVFDINVAGFVTFDNDNPHARHNCAGRIGAMRVGRDQANIPRALTLRFEILADSQKAGIFAL